MCVLLGLSVGVLRSGSEGCFGDFRFEFCFGSGDGRMWWGGVVGWNFSVLG